MSISSVTLSPAAMNGALGDLLSDPDIHSISQKCTIHTVLVYTQQRKVVQITVSSFSCYFTLHIHLIHIHMLTHIL